jgi:isoquinoline 1-oxidoreductase beta subunit
MINESKSRRNFLRSSAVTVGGLSLGFSLSGCSPSANSAELTADHKGLAADVSVWLNIDSNGLITIRVPSAEMGQGVNTALPQLIAEELDADWSMVRSETAPHTAEFVNPSTLSRGTGGSSAVRRWWPTLAKAGAAAKEMLVTAAAQRWDVPASDLSTSNSRVIHSASGRQAGYGELASAAGQLSIPENPLVKSPADYTLIGKPLKRLDSPAKVNGSATYGIDIVVEGMSYATVAASPNFVGELISMSEADAREVNGVQDVIEMPASNYVNSGIQSIVAMPDTVAVVANSYWQAKKGMAALNPQFSDGGVAGVNNASLTAGFMAALDQEGVQVRTDGDISDSLSRAEKLLEADYTVPYLAHLTMEPMNCTAHYISDDVNGDRLEVWAPTQGQSHAVNVLRQAFGLQADQITLHTTFMGGGFGRRFEADFVVQAAMISRAAKKPIKMVWSREEDLQHDYYRPASASRFQVGLNAEGLPVAWKNVMACPSVAQRNFSAAVVNGADPFSVEGAVNIPYSIENQLVTLKQHDTNIPVGSWRSVGSSHNGFYVESMMDEVAVAGNHDPFELRRKLLQHEPRFLTVLDQLEEKSGWKQAPVAGRFRGMAIHESFASIVGEVAEISIAENGAIKIHSMTCVIDCGKVVNPSIIETQLASAMIDGLTAALRGGIKIEEGRVVQSNFDTYKLMHMAEVPAMVIHIVDNDEAPGGIGEPAVPPSMPALTNAIFAATGKRVRSLPIEPSLA